jgi:hypothetical protein
MPGIPPASHRRPSVSGVLNAAGPPPGPPPRTPRAPLQAVQWPATCGEQCRHRPRRSQPRRPGAPPGPAHQEVTVNRIRRARRALARRASPPGTGEPHSPQPNGQEPHPVSRPGSDGLTGRFTQHLAADASVAAGQNRPAASTTNSRRRTITTPRLLPHTIQLCIHCRHNPAGFWVSRTSGQTARRPWCLSCCQDLDPACHHIRPFDLRYLR